MADEPETAPETGTGSDEAAPEATEETTATESPADDSVVGGEDGSEDHAAAQEEDAGKTHVPYSRFKSINERRKAAEAKAAELEAKLAALTPKPEPVVIAPKDKLKRGLRPAPADMTPLEQMEYFALETLEQHPEVIDAWFERTFGMAPDVAAATLSYSSNATRDTIVGQFEKACGERGLDPKNPAIQDAVGRMMDSKKFKTFGEAMDVFVKPKTNGNSPVKKVVKGAESDGVEVGGLSRVRILPRTAREAAALAAQGKSIEQLSVTDLLREMAKP